VAALLARRLGRVTAKRLEVSDRRGRDRLRPAAPPAETRQEGLATLPAVPPSMELELFGSVKRGEPLTQGAVEWIAKLKR
jgi:hypothetical protein